MPIFSIKELFNKLALLLLTSIITMQACKKNIISEVKSSQRSVTSGNKVQDFILGIDKTNGQVKLYETINDPRFLSEGGDILIHKSNVEVIKTYKVDEPIDNAEISKLITQHESNIYTSSTLYDYHDNSVCIRKGVSIWPNGIVNVGIDNDMPEALHKKVLQAMELWNESTNICFNIIDYDLVDLSGDSTYKLAVVYDSLSAGRVAEATVGAQLGLPGTMRISKKAELIDIVHEFTHSFGFIHEHQRPSRDSFIKLQRNALMMILPQLYNETNQLDFDNLENTADKKGMYYRMVVNQFVRKEKVYSDDTTKAPFDKRSIMLYPSYGTDPKVKQILMRYNAPLYLAKGLSVIPGDGEVLGEPEVTDPKKMISTGDIIKVNTVYPDKSCYNDCYN